jgi:predicted P-loop ATPase
MMLGAEKTEYTIAVMWLFMLGAVSRIYYPGCKFDYMPVLVGGQGLGKSTFLDFLSINSAWFNDNFNTLEGDKAFEKLRGMWIVELAELQATRRAKDVESIKSFITSRIDTYRAPYGRRTEQHPRMCVLAGTSNPTDFLTDKTGNRRFLPVTCGVNKPTFNMFENEVATKAVFIQAWGEVMSRFKQEGGNVSLLLAKPLENEAIAKQAEYLEEDPRIGIIQEYLDEHTDIDRVCAMMLWKDALAHEYEMPRPQDINAIHSIMRNEITGWAYIGRKRIKGYGVSRCYERLAEFVDIGPEDVHFD